MIQPYYEDSSVCLYHGDFRDLLPEVLDKHGTPDLCLIDPPYGETSLAWDTWPDGWPALIPGNAMWCFGSMRMFLNRRHEFDGWKLSQDVVWEKNTGTGFTTDRFARVHEHALHWYRPPWGDVHHDTPRLVLTGRKMARTVSHGQPPHLGAIASGSWTDDGTRLQASVIYAPNLHRRGINETEKPEGVVTPLITYGCPPGGLVLDIMAGGCSTLVAARNSGRRAIGIELREQQCAAAVKWRLSQTVLPFGEVS